MAITAKPYNQFKYRLLQGSIDFGSQTFKITLLTSGYTPNYTDHGSYGQMSNFQITGSGYAAQTIPTSTVLGGPYTGASGGTVSWASLTATVRYGCIYRDPDGLLIGLIDFGQDRVFNAEPFELSFPNGLVSMLG